jgi:sialidase-1
MRIFCWFALVLTCAVPAAAEETPELSHVNVFVSGTDGYHTFRIPSIELAQDGSLLAFAEGRRYNDGDPGILKSTDGGDSWSKLPMEFD